MFRSDYISTQLTGEVGWRQPSVSGLPTLTDGNKASASGLYFEDTHPLCSVKNLYYTQENEAVTAEQFNAFLAALAKQATLRVLNDIFKDKTSFVQNVTLYPHESSFKDLITKQGKFVGFRIQVDENRNKAYRLNSVVLSLNAAKTFTLYLFNSQLPTAIYAKSVTTVAGKDTVVALGWVITAASDTYKGGTFYLGYFENDLTTASAYKRNYQQSNEQEEVFGMFINPVVVTPLTATTIDPTIYSNSADNFGLNLDLSVFEDYSDLIINNKSLFSTAIQYAGGAMALEQILNSTRSNMAERLSKEARSFAFVALNGDPEGKSYGLYQRLAYQVKTIRNAIFYQPRFKKVTLS